MPSGVQNTFTYRGDGKQAGREDSGGAITLLWDGRKILEETDSNSAIQSVNTASVGTYGDLVSQRRSGATSYYNFDPSGSTGRLVSAAQSVTDAYAYKAFGEQLSAVGLSQNRSRFIGQFGYCLLPDLTSYLTGARVFSPVLGRWTSADPRIPSRHVSAYTYVKNNPIALIDPSGAAGVLLSRARGQQPFPHAMAAINPAAIWQGFCNTFVNHPLLSNNLVTCVCGLASIADLLSNAGPIEGLDCACNILTTFQVACQNKFVSAASYLGLTILDCAPWLLIALGCEIGAFLGGGIGLIGGPGGALIGAMIGCIAVGHAASKAGTLIDFASYAAQNAVMNLAQSGQLGLLPAGAYKACCSLFTPTVPKVRPPTAPPSPAIGGHDPSPLEICVQKCGHEITAWNQQDWNKWFNECVEDCLAGTPVPGF